MNFSPLYILALMCLLFSSAINANEWEPEFDVTKVRQPLDPFYIIIPQTVSLTVLQTLALELDNIDVTAMVTRDGDYAIFTPLTPLEQGKHELRVVEYAEDGSIIEKGFWVFNVRNQASQSVSNYSADIFLAATSRIVDDNLTEPKPATTSGQGSAALHGELASENWTITGDLDLIYNAQEASILQDNELDLAEYLFVGESATTQVNLGHHSVSQTSLAMENFYRRGVSISRGIEELNSAVTGFILRAEEINGFKDGLGISDSNNTVLGVVIENQPLVDSPEALYISTTYLTGESRKVGISVGAKPITLRGDAWAIVADSTVFDQQLRFRAEIASSVTDVITPDTTDIDLIDATGNAYAFLASYTPQVESDFIFNTGFELSQVDSFYNSIANPNLPNDKELQRLFFNADWLGLGMQFSVAQELDNIDDDESRPQIKTKQNQLLFNYGLTQMPTKGSIFDVLGLPTFSMQWDSTKQNQVKAASIVTQGLAVESHLYRLGADFSKTDWSWGASYSDSQQEDKIDKARRSRTQSTDFHTSFYINPKVLLSPSWVSTQTRYTDNNEDLDSDSVSVVAQLNLTPRFNGQIQLSDTTSTSNSSFSSQDIDVSTLSFQFRWQWIEPKTNYPGFDISVSGTRQDIQDNLLPLNSIEVNQIFLSLEMSLPLASRQ